MIKFKNIENLTFFHLENDEEISKFAEFMYENDVDIHSYYKDVEHYINYIKKSTNPFLVDCFKMEKLLDEFSKMVIVQYDNNIYQKKNI